MRLVALLNRRFAAGAPSNRLDDAGCLIRQFDGLEEVLQPWLPCGSDAEAWCYKYSDRWPTSIINRRARHVWFDQPRDNGGLVLAGAAQVRCAYPGDGDSMSDSKLCDPLGGDGVHCIPGCLPVGQQCPELRRDWECSFPPSALRTALEHQLGTGNIERNNEVRVCYPATGVGISGLSSMLSMRFALPPSPHARVAALRGPGSMSRSDPPIAISRL